MIQDVLQGTSSLQFKELSVDNENDLIIGVWLLENPLSIESLGRSTN